MPCKNFEVSSIQAVLLKTKELVLREYFICHGPAGGKVRIFEPKK